MASSLFSICHFQFRDGFLYGIALLILATHVGLDPEDIEWTSKAKATEFLPHGKTVRS